VRVSAIVPATDRPPSLERCLAALRGADEPPDEVIAVTDPPGDGPAAARNRGAERAGGDVLLFVDADVVVHRDAVARLRDRLGGEPGIAAVFGSYDAAPEANGTVARFRNLLHHHVHHSGAGPAETFWAGLGAVRRSAFESVRGFDEKRFSRASIEDVELGARLSRAGFRVALDPAVQGTHLKSWTLRQMLVTDFRDRAVPWVELVLEDRFAPRTLNLGFRHRLSAIAVACCAGATAFRRPLLAAGAASVLLAANREFYALLARRGGARLAVPGVGLHALHHAAAAAAVPVGALAYLRRRRRRAPS
jgi:GT2 family glycosyltransferase